jgi:hypothetical protein
MPTRSPPPTNNNGEDDEDREITLHVAHPFCIGMTELPGAHAQRTSHLLHPPSTPTPLSIHLTQGLAYTTGSALGEHAPLPAACREAFLAPNAVGLTAGARAWSKHAVRSGGDAGGYWGRARGSVATINERALELLEKVRRHLRPD